MLAAAACGATVRDTYGTPEDSTYSTREAGTRSPYVQYGGPGAEVSTQAAARERGRALDGRLK